MQGMSAPAAIASAKFDSYMHHNTLYSGYFRQKMKVLKRCQQQSLVEKLVSLVVQQGDLPD